MAFVQMMKSHEIYPAVADGFCLDCTMVEPDANRLQGISIARRENLLYQIRFMTGNAAEVIYYGWINYVKSKMNSFLLLYVSKKGC